MVDDTNARDRNEFVESSIEWSAQTVGRVTQGGSGSYALAKGSSFPNLVD